jgi:DNA (cytosine-5)-methyltransferase 1
MKDIKLIELFSGIGGFAKGLQEGGFNITKHYFSEIDKNAIANYKHNFKNAEYIGSVTDVRGQRNQADIITFGSPCQDFSLAGKREGMEGGRSSLILEAIRLISEIQPSVFIWENVKGTFSSNGRADFWAILNAFTNIGNYRLEWQLLNTSWFLPQNRERIYLIGHLAERSKPGIFPLGAENENSIQSQHRQNKLTSTIYGKIPTDGFYVKIAKPSRTDEAKQIRKESMKNGKDYTPFQGKKIDFVESDIMNTITCATQKDNLIKVPTNTKKGFDIMTKEDSLNFSVPTSKTRRGRVGKGVAQTLDTQCNQAVLENEKIRKLTEIECERLQGFPDNWTKFGLFDNEVKEISRTQRYKMCGNAVTVKVVKAIAEKLQIF